MALGGGKKGELAVRHAPGVHEVGGSRSEEGWNFPTEYFAPNADDILDTLLKSAGELGCSAAELALRWILNRPGVSSVKKGETREFSVDESPREDTSLEKLGSLKPVFKQGGTVTAGNAPGTNDGAAATVVTSAETAQKLGKKPMARIVAQAVSGVDWVDVDLVPTKDGQLVARHENEIGGATDVSDNPEFADRRTTKVIDGQAITGWVTGDFTLAELKKLRGPERIPDIRPDHTRVDGQETIPTLQEGIDLVLETAEALYA